MQTAEKKARFLTDKGLALRVALDNAQADLDALAKALFRAQLQREDAEAALAAVQQAVGAQAPVPGFAAAPTVQTVTAYSTWHANADVAFSRHAAALSGPDAEAELLRDMKERMPELGRTGMTAS